MSSRTRISRFLLVAGALTLAACGDDDAPATDNGDAGLDTSEASGDTTSGDTTSPDAATDADVQPDDGSSTPPDAEEDASVDAETDGSADAPDVDEDAFTGECTTAPADYAASIPEPVLYTPRWAFLPWISKDISDRDDTYEFVDGFIDRDIPVGVVVLDSPWDTNYTEFIPNPNRYGDFPGMVEDMSERGVRIVLWTTQFINETSIDLESGGDIYDGPAANFPEADACNFCVNDNDIYFWWKGYGCGLDFFNEDALYWWNEQTRALIELGVAGWKLDFGDSYVRTDTVDTAIGNIPHQQYSEEYYRAMLAWGQSLVGRENFITMVRPYDKSYDFEGRFFARPEHAPVAWVGDNRRDWVGFIDAMDHIFRSAEAGYRVVGSDLGGYLDRDDANLLINVPENEQAFFTWTAVSALSPFMQLHGRANLTPWTFGSDPEATVANYRYWAKLHTELIPVMYSLANTTAEDAPALIDPVGESLEEWDGDWSYVFSGAFYVAPPLDDTLLREVTLPEGDQWFDWWNPAAGPIEGGTIINAPLEPTPGMIPVYLRNGSLLPMVIEDDVTGLLAGTDATRTTLLYAGDTNGAFTELLDDGTTIDYATTIDGSDYTFSWNTTPRSVTIHAVIDSEPADVLINDARIAPADSIDALPTDDTPAWAWDEDERLLIVRVPASETETIVQATSSR